MKKLICIYFIICSFAAKSQTFDSTKSLKAFVKTTNYIIKDGIFSKTDKLASEVGISTNENLGDILQDQSINYLKNYGPGNLSSISSRGGNAQQTSLIYKDFVLNNPLNGIVDFSSIPACFFNDINIIYGLPSSNWGNGGLAGAILLENNNQTIHKSEIEYGNTFGSFNQKTNYLKLSFKENRFTHSTKIFHKTATNNYPFKNQNLEIDRQINSAINHTAIMSESNLILNENNHLNVVYFGQKLNREIPPSLYEGLTNAFQKDINHRIFFSYTKLEEKFKMNLKSAFYDEKNTYIDSTRSIYGYNPCKSLINQIELKSIVPKAHNFSVNLTNSNAFSNGLNYNQKVSINRFSLTGTYVYKKRNWNQLLNIRVLADENFLTPLTFSYGLNKIVNNNSLYFNVGKVYRLPSINDLYWSPGGNQELLPEEGYSIDLGFKWKKDINKKTLFFSPSIYSRWINNWIQWQPSGNFWSAMNIKKVWSRGIETNTDFYSLIHNLKLHLNLKTSYNLSTNVEVLNDNQALINSQLMYCPHYKAVIKVSLSLKTLHLTYYHNYTGYRFTSSDNTSFLPAFHLGRISLSSEFKIKAQAFKIFYKLNNLYNSNYQLIINRPMPLINHEIGINLRLHK